MVRQSMSSQRKFTQPGGSFVLLKDVENIEKWYGSMELPPPKYAVFMRKALEAGYSVKLRSYQETRSKYVTVFSGSKRYKVRFSNHKPNKKLELEGACNYFVGVTNTGARTTDNAWEDMQQYFQGAEK